MVQRTLHRLLRASRKSLLLLGPRQTGKSTLVAALEPDLTINLAHEPTFLEFARNPEELEQRLGAVRNPRTVFLDEIQRLPSLLNTIQSILDRGGAPRFFLTGSSARKLRRGPPGPEWIQSQWELARRDASPGKATLLVPLSLGHHFAAV